MTSNWLSITDAAVVLRLTDHQVLEMAVAGELHSRLDVDRREVCAGAVAAWREQSRPLQTYTPNDERDEH
ncbi:hypothetical protein ACIBK9_47450 [Nonomuraea sp. NPDC050227]|uniref:hypothetical protein n=1 Tax=Nonomuraea sp. NPDC050227 TaxID=3364360 RepID=UPI0037BA3AE7